jgi:hypothetical protein
MSPRHTEGPSPERGFWELLPRRNFRRVLLLLLALVAIVAIKRSGGGSLHSLLDGIAPPPAAKRAPAGAPHDETVRLRVVPQGEAGGTHP